MSEGVLGSDFWYKTLPVLAVSLGIWIITTLFFGGLLGAQALEFNILVFVLSIIVYFVFWIICYYLAIKKMNLFSMIAFFAASFFSGILSSTLIIWASTVIVLELVLGFFFAAFFAGLGATIGLLILGLLLRGRIGRKWIYILIVFGLILLVTEFSLIIIFGYNPYLLITSILVLIWIFGVMVWDGSRLPDTIGAGYWMIAVIDIFLDLINAIIRIFIIIVEIVAES
ncbi:MAG: hypothetical protein GF353_15910 [Candidatus Lokiarchaeota archaeon]|nr:hypothetical protein [Candidatus Lokiarchaeota archaeon]